MLNIIALCEPTYSLAHLITECLRGPSIVQPQLPFTAFVRPEFQAGRPRLNPRGGRRRRSGSMSLCGPTASLSTWVCGHGLPMRLHPSHLNFPAAIVVPFFSDFALFYFFLIGLFVVVALHFFLHRLSFVAFCTSMTLL